MCEEVVSIWLRPGTAESFGIETLPYATPTAAAKAPHAAHPRWFQLQRNPRPSNGSVPEALDRDQVGGTEGTEPQIKTDTRWSVASKTGSCPEREQPCIAQAGTAVPSPPGTREGHFTWDQGRHCLVSRRWPVPWALLLRRARRGPSHCDSDYFPSQ